MSRFGRKIFALAATVILTSGSTFAVADALCKNNCISNRVEELAKHRCCPDARLKMVTAEKLAQTCASCIEQREVPSERAQITPISTAPHSVSERPLEPLKQGALKPLPAFTGNSHTGRLAVPIPISLHRILV